MRSKKSSAKKKRSRAHKLFTFQEDMLLEALVNQYGENWELISMEMRTRSVRQCRERYNNYLRPDISHENWTHQEDELLIQKVNELGRRWSVIAKFFGTRSEASVKNRYSRKIIQDLIKKRDTGLTDDHSDTLETNNGHSDAPETNYEQSDTSELNNRHIEAPETNNEQSDTPEIIDSPVTAPAIDQIPTLKFPSIHLFTNSIPEPIKFPLVNGLEFIGKSIFKTQMQTNVESDNEDITNDNDQKNLSSTFPNYGGPIW